MDLRLKQTRNEQGFLETSVVEAVVTESGDEGIIEEMNEEDGRSVQEKEGRWRCLGETAMDDISKVKARVSSTAWFWLFPRVS